MYRRSISIGVLAASLALFWAAEARSATDPALAGWWKLDDGSGTTAADSSGNDRNGVVLGGAQWVAGTRGGALQLDGTSGAVRISAMNLNVAAGATLTAWIKSAATQRDWCGVIFTRGGEQAGIWITNTRELRYTWSSAAAGWNFASGLIAPTNEWAFVALVIEPTKATIYLNITSGSYNATHAGVTFSGDTYIGWDSSGTTKYFTGAIDDCRIYTRALSSADIAAVRAPEATGPATGPSPTDAATDVRRGTVLSWKPGPYAAKHTVYFGTNAGDVNAATISSPLSVLVSQSQDANTFDPGSLVLGQTYYWRVDEVNAPPTNATVFKGTVWSFTVEPVSYPITGITASASSTASGYSAQNTVNGSGLTGDLATTDTTTTQWLSVVSPTTPPWIEYDLGSVYKVAEMWVWNSNNSFEWAINCGLKSVTIQYSANGTDWAKLGDYEFAQGTSAANYTHNTTVNFTGVAARKVRITANSNFGGKQYGLSEVRFYYIPILAREPNPATGSAGIAVDTPLSWRAGRQAVSHKIYMGTDPNVLTLAGTVGTNSFTPAGLSLGTKYYWRVDEVNTAEAISTWAGDVWNFTTNPFITVDDMEGYNDSTSKIFDIWVDGYGTMNNGSVVGLTSSVNGTFGSTAIFHGGRQSMPLAYNNTGSITNSEATRTFDSIQDWTRNGVKTLTLYFYGQAANITTVPLWVKLTDQTGKNAKVTFGAAGEDKLVLADPAWATWNIPLSSFTGVNAAKVKSMTIGLGNGTGTGTLYIDDIRLYPAVTTTVVTPTMVGWWKLDNDVKDSSGNGNDGTIVGTPTYVAAGKIGASLKLNGTTDYVDCGNAASVNITDVITCSAWIKPTTLANSAYQTFVSKGDVAYVLAHTSGNLLQLAIYDGTWYSANSAAVTSTMNNSWHHVAGTYDGTQIRLYVDGKMAGSTLRTGVIATDTYLLSLGRNSQNTSRLFTGEMDDVRIYRGVLPTSEIIKLANP
jgi:hypothetical protein